MIRKRKEGLKETTRKLKRKRKRKLKRIIIEKEKEILKE